MKFYSNNCFWLIHIDFCIVMSYPEMYCAQFQEFLCRLSFRFLHSVVFYIGHDNTWKLKVLFLLHFYFRMKTSNSSPFSMMWALSVLFIFFINLRFPTIPRLLRLFFLITRGYRFCQTLFLSQFIRLYNFYSLIYWCSGLPWLIFKSEPTMHS